MSEQFEKHGWFETLVDLQTGKQVGTRRMPAMPAGRSEGAEGRQEITISEDFDVELGHKSKRIRVRQPRKYLSVIFPLCGRMISKA